MTVPHGALLTAAAGLPAAWLAAAGVLVAGALLGAEDVPPDDVQADRTMMNVAASPATRTDVLPLGLTRAPFL